MSLMCWGPVREIDVGLFYIRRGIASVIEVGIWMRDPKRPGSHNSPAWIFKASSAEAPWRWYSDTSYGSYWLEATCKLLLQVANRSGASPAIEGVR